MADSDTPIGSLRYLVTIVARVQRPDPNGTGITETMTAIATVHASITPIGMMTFFSSTEPLETTATHRIRFRSDEYYINLVAILRTRTMRDGSLIAERYRVTRTKQIEGRQRFVEVEVLLESAITTPGPAPAPL